MTTCIGAGIREGESVCQEYSSACQLKEIVRHITQPSICAYNLQHLELQHVTLTKACMGVTELHFTAGCVCDICTAFMSAMQNISFSGSQPASSPG